MKVCKICNRHFNDNMALGLHIKFTHKMGTKDYYDEFYKQTNENLCDHCNNNETVFSSLTTGYKHYCSRKCMALAKVDQRKETKRERFGDENYNNANQMKKTKKERYDDENFVNVEKARETNLQRYGVECTLQNPGIKAKSEKTKQEKYGNSKFVNVEKAKETNLQRYGVKNPFQNEEIKEKIKETCLNRFGVKNPFQNEEIKEKRKETCLEKYGVENYSESKAGRSKIKKSWNDKSEEEIKEANKKRESTCLEKYGVRSVAQYPEILEKQQENLAGFKNSWHDYQLPSGEWIRLQGFEPQALDILLESYGEGDIFHRKPDMPEIWYKTKDNIERRYYPDFYIPKDNLVVEVKSTFTYDYQREINELKRQATEEKDFEFKLMIL